MQKETEDENYHEKNTGNDNNKTREQRDKMASPSDMNINIETKAVIESPPINEKKDVESSTQF